MTPREMPAPAAPPAGGPRRLRSAKPRHVAARAAGARLLDVDAAMERAVPADERALARERVVVPLVRIERGAIDLLSLPVLCRPFAAIVLEGVVVRRVVTGERTAAEVLGPDDLLAVGLPAGRSFCTAHTPVRLAVLDERFRVAARRWPGLHDAVHDAMGRQLHETVERSALLHLPRVEQRLVALFAHLAERWGRVTPDGVVIPLRLSHELLGELVGSRRPTVTLALTQLGESGQVRRRAGDGWLLPAERIDAA